MALTLFVFIKMLIYDNYLKSVLHKHYYVIIFMVKTIIQNRVYGVTVNCSELETKSVVKSEATVSARCP